MKRQYSHRHNTGVRAAAWPLALTAALVAVLILFRLLFPGAFIVAATPFWQLGTSLTAVVGNTFAGFGNSAKLSQQNSALATEVSSLQNQNAVLTARTQDLTKLLGGVAGNGSATSTSTASTGTIFANMILAGVLARPPVAAYDTLVVSSGSKDGVSMNAEVYGDGGIPLGTVKSVTAHTATIELFSTSGLATDGWIGQSRIPVTLEGVGAGAFTATLVKTASTTVGDGVYVSGPGAMPIGTVARVETNPSSPTVVLDIQPLANIFSITWVEIAP
jgi:cell shape-determining protein MreC